MSCCARPRYEIHDVDQAAEMMWHGQRGRYEGLPETLWGVWWMSGNPCPELLFNFDANHFIAEKRQLAIEVGGQLNWSYNDSRSGRCELCAVYVGRCVCTKIEATFNEDYTYVDLPITVCGFLPMSWIACQRWAARKVDDNNWERIGYGYCCCMFDPTPTYLYTFRKVVDGEGAQTAAFSDLLAEVKNTSAEKFGSHTSKQIIIVPPAGFPERSAPRAAPAQEDMS